MNERRRSPRSRVTVEVSGKGKSTMEVRVLDLSEHGMLVESPTGLQPSGMCEITVLAPSGEQKVRAEVRRCRAEMVQGDDGPKVVYKAGLEFAEADADGVDIKELISEICGVGQPVAAERNAAENAKTETYGDDNKGFKFAM